MGCWYTMLACDMMMLIVSCRRTEGVIIPVPVRNSVEDFYVRFEDYVGFSIRGAFLHNLQNGHRNLQHYF